MKKFLIFITVFSIMTLNSAFSYKYEVADKFLHQDFWLKNTKNIQKVILSPEEITRYNQENIKRIPQLVNLQEFFNTVQEADVADLIAKYEVSMDPRYLGEELATDDYYNRLLLNANIKKINKGNFAYGFVIRKANIRSFPSNNSLYETPNDIEFDLAQETAVYSGTPIVILHKSKDGKFYFIRTSNYTGWVDSSAVIYADQKSWEDYINTPDFIVITANKLMLSFNPYDTNTSGLIFYMGQKLPLVKNKPAFVDNQSTVGNHVVKIPVEDSKGKLEFKQVLIPFNADISVGYLSYTKENIIKQAFKMQGNRYDWGGHFSGRDCSSFIQDIFNTFGINIPRNTSEMVNMAGSVIVAPKDTGFTFPSKAELNSTIGRIMILENMEEDNRNRVLKNAELGTLLLMKGHVFMYLGFQEGQHFVISDIASVGGDNEIINDKNEKALERIAVNQVSVNTLDTVKPTGVSFLNSLTHGIFIGR
ncbi:MAG: SH3 domain-containing protein [Alphaproteobacteria bacterium]|jgi:cell wall-associated NlpC family hydrolase|nr:SH3 domain-containing protein [Alphaproteobacteria bacterium]